MSGNGGAPWRGTAPELTIAAIVVAVAAAAGYAMAGLAGVLVVAVGAATVSLIVARGLLPRADVTGEHPVRRPDQAAQSISGYSQRRFVVAGGVRYLNAYHTSLRPILEHLLAARLAERHGVNLYQDPAAARRLFCRTRRDADLWRWIDPTDAAAHPTDRTGAAVPPGIPRRTLARLLNRLEQL